MCTVALMSFWQYAHSWRGPDLRGVTAGVSAAAPEGWRITADQVAAAMFDRIAKYRPAAAVIKA